MLPSIFGENLMDEFFDDAFERNFFPTKNNPLYGKHAKNLMKTDIREDKDSYKLAIDLPGFKKDEIEVELKDDYLTVKAAKGLDKDEEDKNGRYIRRERYAGSLMRSFYVGDVKPEDIKGKFESGVLQLEIPKKGTPQIQAPNRIQIE